MSAPEPEQEPTVPRWAIGVPVTPDADAVVHDEQVTDRIVMRTVDVDDDEPDGAPA